MFGGVTIGSSGYPQQHSHSQYDITALPQFQLFDKFPVGCTIDNGNFVGTDNVKAASRSIKRGREAGPMFTQQKLQRSLNNLFQDDAGFITTAMNPNDVSTGLKLSYGEYEHNSSITHSLANSIQLEMDCQNKLLDNYIKVQEENMMKGVRELNQKHTALLINRLETEVRNKLNEKDVEIVTMNRRNMELELKIKQVSMEAQAWHYRAKYNESLVNALKNNLQQVMTAKHVEQQEGYGDSEVDDVASFTNVNDGSVRRLSCKACNGEEVCVLLMPCRHLCLCKDCEMLVENCPVCQVTRTKSVHVFMC
ncbi:BOI-related E3 ubiquitin-protein ligase 1-like [Bidens hawaiensis]|uniref:BOI-related E3 ubiquitin-protein ligase 1-like n=1 Tax=Bidens hawaiensis TaxID=980011 RepID=UPI004049382C